MKRPVKALLMTGVAILVGVGVVYATDYTNIGWLKFGGTGTNVPFINGSYDSQGLGYIWLDPNFNANQTMYNEPYLYVDQNRAVMGTHTLFQPRAAVSVEMVAYNSGHGGGSYSSISDPAEAYMKSSGNAQVRTKADGDVVITLGN